MASFVSKMWLNLKLSKLTVVGKSVAADRLDGDVVVMHRANQTSYTDLNLWKRQAEIVAENQASQIWAKIHRVRKNSSQRRGRMKNLLVVATTGSIGRGVAVEILKRIVAGVPSHWV